MKSRRGPNHLLLLPARSIPFLILEKPLLMLLSLFLLLLAAGDSDRTNRGSAELFANAWTFSPTTRTVHRDPSTRTGAAETLLSATPDSCVSMDRPQQMVLVLGGSGYIGRRVCRELVAGSDGQGGPCKVVSISRHGKPPAWCFDDNNENDDDDDDDDDENYRGWSEKVEWIRHDLGAEASSSTDGKTLVEKLESVCRSSNSNGNGNGNSGGESSPLSLEPWETSLVGCIGNVNPSEKWLGLWGLGFNDDRLFEENGIIYDRFLNETKSLWEINGDSNDSNSDSDYQVKTDLRLALRRCVLLSIDYTGQKCLEGPIEGYVEGKRLAERRFVEVLSETASSNSSSNSSKDALENVVVIGLPNFVFGGKRFLVFGKTYRKLVESFPLKAYVKSMNALRSISGAEDWVEALFLSSPVEVDTAGKATALAARGLVTRDLVNDGLPRKQGFFNTSGKPIEYDDVLFVDGTHKIEELVAALGGGVGGKDALSASSRSEPRWEGALIGKRPYLFPFPVAMFFLTFFWAVVTEQFVRVPPTI